MALDQLPRRADYSSREAFLKDYYLYFEQVGLMPASQFWARLEALETLHSSDVQFEGLMDLITALTARVQALETIIETGTT